MIGGLVIAIILACTGIYSHLIAFLNLLGIFIPPLGGVMMGDYFFVYKRRLPRVESVHFKTLRYSPVIAYIVGAAAAFLADRFAFGVPPLFGILVAGACMPLCNLLLGKCGINDMHPVDENADYV